MLCSRGTFDAMSEDSPSAPPSPSFQDELQILGEEIRRRARPGERLVETFRRLAEDTSFWSPPFASHPQGSPRSRITHIAALWPEQPITLPAGCVPAEAE